MAIKYPKGTSLGSTDVKNFPRVQYDKIVEIIDAINDLNDGSVTMVDLDLTGTLTSTDTTQSTNKDTGAIVTEGGLGVEKNANIGGTLGVVGVATVSNATASTVSTDGALVVTGGIGVAKNSFFGDSVNVADDLTVVGSIAGGDFFLDAASQVGSDTPSLTKAIGTITTAVTATAAGAYKTVTMTHTLIGASSKVFVSLGDYGGTGTPLVAQVTPSLGQVEIKIYNAHSAAALSAAMDLDFFIVNPN